MFLSGFCLQVIQTGIPDNTFPVNVSTHNEDKDNIPSRVIQIHETGTPLPNTDNDSLDNANTFEVVVLGMLIKVILCFCFCTFWQERMVGTFDQNLSMNFSNY